jgi:type II secretory pathway pseudopilin PulG
VNPLSADNHLVNLDRKDLDAKAESGFTLIELLVAAAMMVVVCGAAVVMLISVMHRQPKISTSAQQIGIARNAIEKITADIRQGESATSSSPSQLTLNTICDPGGVACTVEYNCSGPLGEVSCARTVAGGARTTVVTGLRSANLFAVEGTPPSYVEVTVELPNEDASRGLTKLQDGAALHNASLTVTG